MNIEQFLNNPFINSLAKFKNPQSAIEGMISNNPQFANNGIIQNAMKMANNGDMNGLKTMAENLYRERGLDINEAYTTIQNMFR